MHALILVLAMLMPPTIIAARDSLGNPVTVKITGIAVRVEDAYYTASTTDSYTVNGVKGTGKIKAETNLPAFGVEDAALAQALQSGDPVVFTVQLKQQNDTLPAVNGQITVSKDMAVPPR